MRGRWGDVTLDDRYVYREQCKDTIIHLTRLESQLFRLLLSACGSWVSTDRIMDVLYGECLDPPYEEIVAVLVSKIKCNRRLGDKLGIHIKHRFKGWYLEVEPTSGLLACAHHQSESTTNDESPNLAKVPGQTLETLAE